MEMHFGYRGVGNTARILLTAVTAVLISAPVSAGPRTDEAITVCSDALKADYGANGFSDTNVRNRKGRRYRVYTTVRLADGKTIRFSCLTLGDTIVTVQVLDQGSRYSSGSGSGWTSAEPYRVKPEPDADVPSETTPEQELNKSELPLEIDPEFKTPGTGTGFKTPGTGTGSQFKPAK